MLSVLFNQPVIERFCENVRTVVDDELKLFWTDIHVIEVCFQSILTESFYDWLVEENAKHLLPLI